MSVNKEISSQKEILLEKRKDFFNRVLVAISCPVTEMDKMLRQEKYYVAPDLNGVILNVELGDMAIPVNGDFFGKKFQVFYSLWQLGSFLKIGVSLYNQEIQGAFTKDTYNEVATMWGRDISHIVDIARESVFYDWEFTVPNLYDEYKNMESFIFGVRHMHMRTMRIIHDECYRLSLEGNKDMGERFEDVDQFKRHLGIDQ